MLKDPLPDLEDDYEDNYYDHIPSFEFDEDSRPIIPPEYCDDLPREYL